MNKKIPHLTLAGHQPVKRNHRNGYSFSHHGDRQLKRISKDECTVNFGRIGEREGKKLKKMNEDVTGAKEGEQEREIEKNR